MAEVDKIYTCAGAYFVPCHSINIDGTPRVPDGVNWFTVEQVAQKTGNTVAAIEEGFAIFLREATQSPPIASELNRRREILRRKFSHLPDELFEQFMEECRSRNVSPWGRDVWAEAKRNSRTKKWELIMELSVDGFRARALATGKVEAIFGPHWCSKEGDWQDVWKEDQPPYAARMGIVRFGMAEPLWTVAKWEDYAVFDVDKKGNQVLSEPWLRRGAFMLGKCCECLAYRRSFADVLNGFYSSEEMQQSRNPHPTPEPERDGGEELLADAPFLAEEDQPQTSRQFHLRLIDYGIKDRDALVETFRSRFPMLWGRNMPAFYQRVLKEIRQNPAAYGAVRPEELSA